MLPYSIIRDVCVADVSAALGFCDIVAKVSTGRPADCHRWNVLLSFVHGVTPMTCQCDGVGITLEEKPGTTRDDKDWPGGLGWLGDKEPLHGIAVETGPAVRAQGWGWQRGDEP